MPASASTVEGLCGVESIDTSGETFDGGFDGDTLCRLYLGVKQLVSADGGKINAGAFRSWIRTYKTEVSLKRVIWVVPASNEIDSPDAIDCFKIDVAHISQLPSGFDSSSFVFYDSCVSRQQLGPGVMSLEVAVKEVRKQPQPKLPLSLPGCDSLRYIEIYCCCRSQGHVHTALLRLSE